MALAPNEPYIADYKESKKRFPLTVAALLGHADIVAMLLEAGANPCAASAQKCENTLQLLHSQQTFASTPEQAHDFARIIAQFQAALQQQKTIAQPQAAIPQKSPIPHRQRNVSLGLRLLKYIKSSYYEMAETLLNNFKGSIDLSLVEAEGETALMTAIAKNHMPLVRLLIAHSTQYDLNIQAHDGISALLIAIFNNNRDAVALLLQAGVDKTLIAENLTPLVIAQDLKRTEIVQLLAAHRDYHVRASSSSEPLLTIGLQTSMGYAFHATALTDDLTLLQQHIKINRQVLYEVTALGVTIIEEAIFHNSMRIVKFLIEEDYFDPCKPSANGSTPLQTAMMVNNVEVVTYLLQREDKDITKYEPTFYTDYVELNKYAQPGSPEAIIRDALVKYWGKKS